MSKGKIIEQGYHDALLDKRAANFNLVEAQRITFNASSDEKATNLDDDDLECNGSLFTDPSITEVEFNDQKCAAS